jgi:hypothetical protein
MLHSAERAAEAIRDAAGLGDDAGPVGLALAVMGAGAILVFDRLREKATYRPDSDRIWIQRGLSSRAVAYLVGHELAERFLALHGEWHAHGDREGFADAVSARLIAPRAIVRAAMRAHGDDHAAVARALRTTQTIALVRMAEEGRRPLAAVTPGRIIVRGAEGFVWPDEETIRRLEQGPVPEGVERRTITDARRRFGLIAA